MAKYGYSKRSRSKRNTSFLVVIVLIIVISVLFVRTINLQNEVDRNQDELAEIRSDREEIREDYEELDREYHGTLDDLDHMRTREEELEEKLENSSTFYTPEPDSLVSMAEDIGIHENDWTDNYDCIQFSFDLLDELRERGVFSCPVLLYFEERDIGHMLLKVETTEGGTMIEPQDNTLLEDISVGDDYCELLNWECQWIVEEIHTCSV